MCLDAKTISSTNSWFFIGFIFGIFFLTFPDKYGRKGTMNIIMPLFVVSCYFTVFSQTLFGKSLGYFLQGLFHIKVMNSYTHMFDLIDEKSKSFAATTINCLDSATLVITGLTYSFLTRDATWFIETVFYVSLVGVILYLLFIPESPRWLLLND
jgi:MFS family permease